MPIRSAVLGVIRSYADSAVGGSVYYDRTVTQALREALASGGVFAFLVETVRQQHLADLQLRGYPAQKTCWATMYCGLTKVIDVYENSGEFWLKGKIADPSWDPAWGTRRPPSQWTKESKRVASYVDSALRGVPARFTNEGALQAMLCTRAGDLFSVIDREAVIGFRTIDERAAMYASLQHPLAAACPPDSENAWFAPPSFGGELDLLAVDRAGRLLVIEVKPGSSTRGIAWAPLQASFYAALFRAWADEAEEHARDVLESMLSQRIELGISSDPPRPLAYPLDIVPVVAIGGPPRSRAALPRLRVVQSALLASGAGWPNLEIWQVHEAVTLTQIPPTANAASPKDLAAG
jgi:hypothetical protein